MKKTDPHAPSAEDLVVLSRAGKVLQGYRNKAGYTQEGVADLLSVSSQTIYAIEAGRTHTTTRRYLRLCDLYGCEMSDVWDACTADIGDAHEASRTLDRLEVSAEGAVLYLTSTVAVTVPLVDAAVFIPKIGQEVEL